MFRVTVLPIFVSAGVHVFLFFRGPLVWRLLPTFDGGGLFRILVVFYGHYFVAVSANFRLCGDAGLFSVFLVGRYGYLQGLARIRFVCRLDRIL